jgi:hypothetical protein
VSRKDTEQKQGTDLTPEELERLDGEPLPERVQMSTIGPVEGWFHIEPIPGPVPPVDESS